jgi:hypothetical protein
MKFENIEKPKSLMVALIFSGIAWVLLRFLQPPANELREDTADNVTGTGEPCYPGD